MQNQAGCSVPELDVFVIGGVGVDTIVAVPELPLPVRDSISVPPIGDFVGHTGNGVALGCLALGLRTEIADVIGDDDQGRLIRRRYAAAGLRHHFQVHESGTRRSVNLIDPAGRRVALYDPRHPADLVVDPELYLPGIRRSRHVHVSIMNWARRALAEAAEAGRSTSTDLHDWDGRADYHRDFAFQADIVFVSTAELGGRAGQVAADIFGNGRASAVIAMAGADGCLLFRPGQRVLTIPAARLPGVPVLDSNGAGDSFVAAFLYAWLRGEPWQAAALAGTVAGAFACGTFGTHTSFIDAGRLAAELSRLRA